MHLCSFHHRALHEGGYRIQQRGDGVLRFVSRYGVEWKAQPAAPVDASADRLVREQANLGIEGVRVPVWDGGPMDYGMAVTGLLLADGVG